MKRVTIILSLFLLFFSTQEIIPQESNYLFLKCKNDKPDSCGYVTNTGKVIIPFGKYSQCFTDTFKNFAIVLNDQNKFVGIDRNENILFEVFNYDNGPDYPSGGLFRIIKNNKIGFADLNGKIVIEPRFTYVMPFKYEYAAFCKNCRKVKDGEHEFYINGKWGFINREGEIVTQSKYDKVIEQYPDGKAKVELKGSVFTVEVNSKQISDKNMNYKNWCNLLYGSLELINKAVLKNDLKMTAEWKNETEDFVFDKEDDQVLHIKATRKDNNNQVVEFFVIPWRNFCENSSFEKISAVTLLTVMDFAVIYYLPQSNDNIYKELIASFKNAVDYKNNEVSTKEKLQIPEDVQVISSESYKNYVVLQVAVPGSRLPNYSEWMKVSNKKMLYLSLVPDAGQVKTYWFFPSEIKFDPYYASVEDRLMEIFETALEYSIERTNEREKVYNEFKNELRKIFNAANSYVNLLYEKYENRLHEWLLVPHEIYDGRNMFPDYTPKKTPDTALDYMPSLNSEFEKLPGGELKSLPSLVQLFKEYRKTAELKPGKWEDGNMILGANPREYRPSAEELILAEIGERIEKILDFYPKKEILKVLGNSKKDLKKAKFRKFTFIHSDVMGSGRFFYVNKIKETEINLK